MFHTKYNTLLVQPIFQGKYFLQNRCYIIIKTQLTPWLQPKSLSMTSKINTHNVFIYLYKKF